MQAILYCTLVPLPLATLFVWSRLRRPRRLIAYFWQVFSSKVAENDGIPGDNAVATATTFNLAELKAVYRFKDVKQVSLLCRGMRQWDEDGVPDPAAADFGEFMLKVSQFARAALPCNSIVPPCATFGSPSHIVLHTCNVHRVQMPLSSITPGTGCCAVLSVICLPHCSVHS